MSRPKWIMSPCYRVGFHHHLVTCGMEYDAAAILEQEISDQAIEKICLKLGIDKL